MRPVVTYLRTASTALRLLVALTVVVGIAYPLAVTAIAQIPGLRGRADGSLVTRHGLVVGSSELGQRFTDRAGRPLPQYFQSRPSDAGAGYDPTSSGAGNLGPESDVDVLPDPSVEGDTGTPSLLTQVCTRSLEVGRFDGVSGARPYCSPDGTGSVLAVFWSGPGYEGHVTRVVSVNQGPGSTPFVRRYRGVPVQLARYGADYSRGQIVPVRGDAPSHPAVPADAVTASGSGLDPDISAAYAGIQEHEVARTRGISVAQVRALVAQHTDGRPLGFMGEPTVNVLQLNLALDRRYPYRAR
ncbi:potassium-transporting ATPase subunit C [Jatrophihabitans endophyticus]|uniref:potassium-transporting ATPase subunit C n=1 Tax=Jatrophihabitans endophyticus TaxID=1206085 RepID=UPI0019D96C0A|nr:potassium-transporting ATPase subunit C [Jatrophihabitans endophyticus]MBE7187154.1 potassium-transporting ATPase subunit C [Jatrophihabitans endophyticus]